LYVKIIIKPDENTIIQENNILYKLPITPFEAVLGAKIEIPSINGNVILNIPPQTTSGQQFRISGKGLQTNGKFGDMIVTVEISIPKNLSDDELNLYGKLKKIANTSVRDN
jgi:curved DNA-binding protein